MSGACWITITCDMIISVGYRVKSHLHIRSAEVFSVGSARECLRLLQGCQYQVECHGHIF